MELVERDEQLESLTRLLEDARTSGGRVALVGGEAGAGKTSLARAFVAAAPAGVRVLWGVCDALSTPRPLAPFRDMDELAPLLERSVSRQELLSELLGELNVSSVMVVEDAHWIDEATLDVLRFVGRRIERSRSLVLVTYRDDELGQAHGLRVLLGDLATAPGCVRVPVPPLSRAGVAALAAGSAVAPDRLHRVTGGNAFYVTEVLAAPGWTVPATVSDAVLARVSRLTPEARALLELVSLAPGGLEPEIVGQLLPDAEESLDECSSSGVLLASAELATFRNELARLAVEGAIPATTRRLRHRTLLEVLETAPDVDPARLAHHADAAGDGDRLLRYALVAARQAAARGAHREAAAQLERTLRFAGRLDPRERAELFEARSYECYLTGELERAIEAQERAVSCRRAVGEAEKTGDALRSLSRLLRFCGRIDRAEAVGKQALDVLAAEPPGHELALAYNNLAHIRATADDAEGTRAWATQALELSERLDDVEARAYALTNLGAADFLDGELRGVDRLEQALALALATGLDEIAGRAHVNLVWRPLQQRAYEIANRHLHAGLEFCTAQGLDLWRLFLVACQARLELDQGRWDAAEELAAACIRDPRSWPVPRVFALAVLGALRARRGDPDVWAPLDEAHALAEPTGELQQIAPTAVARAEAAWVEGNPELVGETTERALALAVDRKASWVIGDLACWRRRAGIDEEIPAGTADLYVRQLSGDAEGAARGWIELGCPYEAALARADAPDPELIQRGLAALQGLGARPAAGIVSRRLRARGVHALPRGPRAATRANPGNLTARQLDVLVLLDEGMSNADIAARLFITEKTAAHHVSAILRKLDVRSRGEAAAAARNLGIAPRQT
jgi:DNA-binding CsgD family transcriptional regulator/tetratricopeptide (TPR) repeat protein